MFVRNDCTRDVRVLREAASLAAVGYRVTVMALLTSLHGESPEREERDGVAIIRVAAPREWRDRWRTVRYRPWRARTWWATEMKTAARSGRGARAAGIAALGALALPFVAARLVQWLGSGRSRPVIPAEDDTLDWLVRWRWSILGWAGRAAAAAPPGEIFHGHDLNALGAAVAAQARSGGRLVYDSHELYLESGSTALRPRWARNLLGRLERRWVRAADAVITVNDSIATELARRYRIRRTLVVRNCPPRWTPPAARPDLIRETATIPPGAPIVLYHGGFLADRGLEQICAAMLEPGLGAAHAAFLGFGQLQPMLEAAARDRRYRGRLHVLPAVDPSALLDWVASADVSAIPNQPTNLNQLYSTPNKLFESIAAGTPVVSGDTPDRRQIVVDDPDGPLGELCDPTDPSSIAAGIRRILDRSPAEREDLRRRCLRAGQERLNWEHESARLLELYAELAIR
jgi:glycosyltransferase involved in cell wall biosynthesis